MNHLAPEQFWEIVMADIAYGDGHTEADAVISVLLLGIEEG